MTKPSRRSAAYKAEVAMVRRVGLLCRKIEHTPTAPAGLADRIFDRWGDAKDAETPEAMKRFSSWLTRQENKLGMATVRV